VAARQIRRWHLTDFQRLFVAITVAASLFLVFMASLPDSHIARKFGLAQAQFLCASAAEHAAVAGAARTRSAALRAWDVALKARGLNPGTSADLTVVTLFWDGLLRADGLGAD